MSTVHVQPTGLDQALQYLSGVSHNPELVNQRNIAISTNCRNLTDFVTRVKREVENADGRVKNDLYSVRLSYSLKEFDPNSETDQKLALEASEAFARGWLESKGISRPWAVFEQRDGESGLLHCHVLICNPKNGKAIPHGASALRMQDVNDRVMSQFMIDHGRSAAVQAELAGRKRGRDDNSELAAANGRHYGKSKANSKASDNKDHMKKALADALKARNRADFLRRLQAQGVRINRRRNESDDDLWFGKNGKYHKSLSLEYRGTTSRTATLTGFSLEQIDSRLKQNDQEAAKQQRLQLIQKSNDNADNQNSDKSDAKLEEWENKDGSNNLEKLYDYNYSDFAKMKVRQLRKLLKFYQQAFARLEAQSKQQQNNKRLADLAMKVRVKVNQTHVLLDRKEAEIASEVAVAATQKARRDLTRDNGGPDFG